MISAISPRLDNQHQKVDEVWTREAQLLAQDVETATATSSVDRTNNDDTEARADDQLKKKLTDILVDNATLRKQVNSVLRCALSSGEKSDKDEDEENEETPTSGKKIEQ